MDALIELELPDIVFEELQVLLSIYTSGDSHEFDEKHEFGSSVGQEFTIGATRGEWLRVEFRHCASNQISMTISVDISMKLYPMRSEPKIVDLRLEPPAMHKMHGEPLRDCACRQLEESWRQSATGDIGNFSSVESEKNHAETSDGGPCLFQWWEQMKEKLSAIAEEQLRLSAGSQDNSELDIEKSLENVEISQPLEEKETQAAAIIPDKSSVNVNLGIRPSLATQYRVYASNQQTDRKSTFQGFFLHPLLTPENLNEALAYIRSWNDDQRAVTGEKKVRDATHFIFAYISRQPTTGKLISDYDDGGEPPAGKHLVTLLHRYLSDETADGVDGSKATTGKKVTSKHKSSSSKISHQRNNNSIHPETGLLLVCRWYGGVHLGAARFRLIMQSAKDVMSLAAESQWK